MSQTERVPDTGIGHDSVLLALEDRMRSLADATEVQRVAAELLGTTFQAERVGLLAFYEADGMLHPTVEWPEGQAHPLDQVMARLGSLRQGETATLPEMRSSDLSDAEAAVLVPVLRSGQLASVLWMCRRAPPRWSGPAIALLEAAAERIWRATERVQEDARLRASEALFRQLAETVREVFYVLELDGARFAYVSPAYEEVWGTSLEELHANPRTFLATIHPDDRDQVRASYARLLRGEPVEGEYRLLRRDGSVRHIRDRAFIAIDPLTGNRRALGLAADVTDRRRAEERLQMATEAAGIGIFDVDLRTGAIEWDTRLRALWGVPEDATVTDETFVAGIHDEDRPLMHAAVAQALDANGDGLYRAEYRIVDAGDGRERWIAATGRAHFGKGHATRLIGTVQDISERKEAEAAVLRSEARFGALAASVPALIFLTDQRGRNLYVNQRYREFTGLQEDELLGQSWQDILHQDDRARAAATWGRDLDSLHHSDEVRIRRADGVWRWHLTRTVPVTDDVGRVAQWVGAHVDIEEIVEAREALAKNRAVVERANLELEERVAERTASLAQANAQLAAEIERREAMQAVLAQAQKLEAVGRLTSGIAHDFNNVIAAIAGGFSVIERRTTDPRLIEVARHGASAAERGGLLVRQLLAFARQQVLAPRSCDLAALLREAEPLIARSLGPGIELKIECPVDLGNVRIDPVQLEAALINLAVNARDAMPDGGCVTMTAYATLPGEPGRPADLGSSPAVALSVADTGAGMGPDILSHVIEPFFTTKPLGQGTGLGLAMVHGFVHQSGGALIIDSREGEGTTVTLHLPQAREGAAEVNVPAPAVAELSEDQGGSGLTVLLVDDDVAVRAVTAAQLTDLGYEVIVAGGGAEALIQLDTGLEIDAVLSDVVMPGMDGVALAAELRRRWPGLPVLLMTGHADRARLKDQAVLDKPFTLQALAAALAERAGPRGGAAA